MRCSLNDLANKHGTDKGDGNYDKHNYAFVYEELISTIPIRDRKIKILEIGIWDPRNPGASMRMWREFLPDAELFGIDINRDSIVLADECNAKIFIADQNDVASLKSVMEQIGDVDFVCDDGSHINQHIKNCFSIIWPFVAEGGVYAIEDLHAPHSNPVDEISNLVKNNNPKHFFWPSSKLLIAKK